MAKLFISYSRKDSIPSRLIILALKEMGQDVWVDWEDIPPASDWLEQIFQGIEGADAFIFMISPDSIKSEVCTQELRHAAKNNRRIIPVVLQQVEPKDTNELIRKLNWIFIRDENEFASGLERVKTAIELDFDWVEEHNRLQLRALEWDRRKDASLLLRGRDLRIAKNSIIIAVEKLKDPQPTALQNTYIQHSNINERRLYTITTLAINAIIALAILAYTAFSQSKLANLQAIEANEQKSLAEARKEQALESEREARKAQQEADAARIQAENARAEAVTARNNAAAQRSIARAQIYQFRPGELYVSTLLAIDAWQVNHSDDAQEILRENISLLPIPIKQMTRAGGINAIEFNNKGDVFVTAGADGTTCAWQTATGAEVFCVDSEGTVNDAVFIPNTNVVIIGDEAGSVQFINLDSKSIELSIPIGSPVLDVAVSKDGKFAAVTSETGSISIIDLTTRKKVGKDLDGRNTRMTAFHPKEFKLASGSKDGVISIWNLTTNSQPLATRKHAGEILALAFSPDGSILVSGGADGAAVVTETKTGKELFRCLHSGQINDIAFAPNGAWFVTVSNDRNIRVWDSNSGVQLLSMSQSNIVRTVKVSANGQWIATTGDDKTVRVWNAVTGTESYQIPLKGGGRSLGFSKDGKYLVSGDQNGYVNIWDMSAILTPVNSIQFKGVTSSAVYSPAGNWLALSEDKRVWLLNSKIGSKIIKSSDQPYGELLSNSRKVVFSVADKRLGVLTANNEIVIYNTQTNNRKTIKPQGSVEAFLFSPDERLLFVGDSTGNIHVWEAVTGQAQGNAISFQKHILAMAATSKFLIVALEDELHVLDINTFKELDNLNPQGKTELLVFSPDGSHFATSNSNGQILIWELVNEKFHTPMIIKRDNVSSLAFSPDNNLLAAGTVDNIFLFDLPTLEETVRIPLTGTVNSVSFSTDGATLMSATLKFLQFWDLANLENARITKDNIVASACQHLLENLSEDQWNLLFENEDYQVLCPNLTAP